MERKTELALIEELLTLKAERRLFTDENVARNPVDNYVSQERFEQERTRLFRRLPCAVAHASELPKTGSFVRREVGGTPLLVTRDESGRANAFLNVCRHRGTRLVDEPAGCKRRFACPYHAWTYSSAGDLISAPHYDAGFGELDKSELGLKQLNCVERFGFIWVWSSPDDAIDFDAWFAGLDDELESLGIGDLKIAAEDTAVRRANWKILVEGGIEAYHFRVAHRRTIGPHFEDNLSSYRTFGPHIRSVLPRTSMQTLSETSRDDWRLRDHANVIYILFPTTQILVVQDHLVWLQPEPLGPGETRVRIVSLAPASDGHVKGVNDAHWTENHQITTTTLEEDFVIGESIQENLSSGANSHMVFGRFEGALGRFNDVVDEMLQAGDEGQAGACGRV